MGVCMWISAQCGKKKNFFSPKKISSIQLFSNFFSKTITFTKSLRNFHTLQSDKTVKVDIAELISRKIRVIQITTRPGEYKSFERIEL